MERPHYIGKIEDLDSLGNVSGDLPQRKVVPYRCSDGLSGLVLKEYTMEEKGKVAPTRGDIVDVHMLLRDELEKGNMNPLSGMGFSILSSGILNVCRWDSEYIDVIVPQIYTLKKGLWMPQKVETVGAFCSGEKRVYDHENNAWLRFLSSERTDQDKSTYLNDFLTE
ncbi:hypothetical protein HZC32_00985 [Candidatus Woesearchaeota archaeon]|nr:hypothetical protein [Candidatus Woesearchaeota archaeon]